MGGSTYKIAGAVCASTANTLAVVHIVVEAHWIDLIGEMRRNGRRGWWLDASDIFAPPPSISKNNGGLFRLEG